MKKIFAILLSLLMVMSVCMAVSASEAVPFDSSWEISVTSQTGTSIKNAFDGDLSTNWHTNYKAEGSKILSHDECPHVITINFGKDTEISGWRYTPRKDNETGTVLLNGLEWTARSKENVVIEAGARVKVCAVDGVKVIVEQVEE